MLIISFASPVLGIAPEADSLMNRLSFASDSEKVSIYSQLSLLSLSSSLNESMIYAMEAKSIADSIGDIRLKAEAYNRLGTVYYTYNHFSRAMDYLLKALNLRMVLHDSVGMSASYVNIGVLYHSMGNIDKAIEFTQQALDIREKLGIHQKLGAILNNLLVYFTMQEKYQQALEYGNRALDFYLQRGIGGGMSDIYVNLGELYYKQKNLNKAYEFYRKAKQHAKNIHDISRIININTSLINVLLDKKDYSQTQDLINESIPLAENYGELEGLTLLYEQATRFYEARKKFQQAYKFQEKYGAVKDSLQVRQQKDKILRQQARFNAELANQQIRTIKQNGQLQKIRAENSNLFIFRTAILLFFLVLLIAVLFGFLRTVARAENELKEQNLILDSMNTRLHNSDLHLQSIIRSKDKFFSIIAHDIINPFQPLLGLSELLITDIDRLKDNEIKKYAGLIHESANRIFMLLEDLLQWTRAQTGKLSYKPVKLPLPDVTKEAIENCIEQAGIKKIHLTVAMDKNFQAYGDKELYKATIRNLVNNAIKFTPGKGKITISAKKINKDIEITVEDTGIGISSERIGKLFRIETISSTKGTQNEEGTGLGLLLCKEFVELNKGKIRVESKLGVGTAFHFTIPVFEK
ncbi:MAG: tetratricopeptide repeat protein [Chlorobi bacterium]|nr:tetratricopeptide repeat protein [Chlorobiota bacterium]